MNEKVQRIPSLKKVNRSLNFPLRQQKINTLHIPTRTESLPSPLKQDMPSFGADQVRGQSPYYVLTEDITCFGAIKGDHSQPRHTLIKQDLVGQGLANQLNPIHLNSYSIIYNTCRAGPQRLIFVSVSLLAENQIIVQH